MILFFSPCLAMNPVNEGEALGAKLVTAGSEQLANLVDRGMYAHPIRSQIAALRAETKSKMDKMTPEQKAKAKPELEADFKKKMAPLMQQEKIIKLHARMAIARKMLEKTLADIQEAESSSDDTKALSLSTSTGLKLTDSM